MTTARKFRVLTLASTALVLAILILQFTQVISGFWSVTLLVIVGIPVTIAWVILERRLGAEKMRDAP
ncbi:hypothetical protein ACIQTZ_19680 [Paenarthrobacter sp. NPDC090520]|uniref:hypothetical protein n=1 Tax=Paenarthrobacter sp. NPDC090520 TaxID=3364382 RepID=UPI00382F8BE2